MLWLESVRRTTAGIHNVIFSPLLGYCARKYDVTPRHLKNNKIFSLSNIVNLFPSFSLILDNDCKATKKLDKFENGISI